MTGIPILPCETPPAKLHSAKLHLRAMADHLHLLIMRAADTGAGVRMDMHQECRAVPWNDGFIAKESDGPLRIEIQISKGKGNP